MRFPFIAHDNTQSSMMPRLPLTLHYGQRSVDVIGLVDTGSVINVLPYQLGISLGIKWEEQTQAIQLVGALGRFPARAISVIASHPILVPDASIEMVFAWTSAPDAPLIFGQINFFLHFDVCFYRSQGYFDVRLKET